MSKPAGTIIAWRDSGGTLRRRWFKTRGEAESFKEQITGAPGICDYLSDILAELEAHRSELEAIHSELDAIHDILGGS